MCVFLSCLLPPYCTIPQGIARNNYSRFSLRWYSCSEQTENSPKRV